MITENLSTLKIHKLTKEQYDREIAAGNIDESALYLTPDEEIDLSQYATMEQLNDKVSASSLSNYYTKTEIDDMGLTIITVDDIDTICGVTDVAN